MELGALPLPVLEAVVRLVGEDGERRASGEALRALRALPQVSKATLAALQRLRVPVGRLRARSVEEAVQQATAAGRAFDLHTLTLSCCDGVTDVSALVSQGEIILDGQLRAGRTIKSVGQCQAGVCLVLSD